MIIQEHTATDAWLNLINNVEGFGMLTEPRGMKCKELLNVTTIIPMRKPIVTVPGRGIGYRFMFAEAHWILTGDNRVSTIEPYSPIIKNFSDNGETFFGAYGPKILDQLPYIISKLVEDQNSRQAVLTIWREKPGQTKDVPCTVSVQFFIRDGKLYCIDNMRSSDAWLGWPYDVFNFTMLSGYISLILNYVFNIRVTLGDIYMNLGSSHLYEKHFDSVKKCLQEESLLNKPRKFRYPFFEPLEYWRTPGEFIRHLKAVAEQKPSELTSDWVHCVAEGLHNKKGEGNEE